MCAFACIVTLAVLDLAKVFLGALIVPFCFNWVLRLPTLLLAAACLNAWSERPERLPQPPPRQPTEGVRAGHAGAPVRDEDATAGAGARAPRSVQRPGSTNGQ